MNSLAWKDNLSFVAIFLSIIVYTYNQLTAAAEVKQEKEWLMNAATVVATSCLCTWYDDEIDVFIEKY